MKKRFLAILLTIVMMASMLPTVAFASETDSSTNATSEITLGDTTVKLSQDGRYTVTGNGTAPIIVDSNVTATITLKDAAITIADTFSVSGDVPTRSAIHIKPGAKVSLVLEGTNAVTAGIGGAGIYIEAAWVDDKYSADTSAFLSIEGTGSLTATGGNGTGAEVTNQDLYMGSGAGIGGSGVGVPYTAGGDFGTVTIKGGTITAIGGDAPSNHRYIGAGAGIGGGGIGYPNAGWTYTGSIYIEDGDVTATGGAVYKDQAKYLGAAGIGSGCTGMTSSGRSDITIAISGGEVHAYGNKCGAGIGSGNSCYITKSISITGGNITAIGGENIAEATGGAGIGSGDYAYVGSSIYIGGNATVYAEGKAGSAGIGGSATYTGAKVDLIHITDNANVTAIGGYNGAPGIGPGNRASGDDGASKIKLNTTGTIVAYGSTRDGAYGSAAAIGSGSAYYESLGGPAKVDIVIGENSGPIWMFARRSTTQNNPAMADIGSVPEAIWYTYSGTDSYPAADAIIATNPGSEKWQYSTDGDGKITISLLDSENLVLASHVLLENYVLGSWATVNRHSITFDANSGSGEMETAFVAIGRSYPLPSCGFTAPAGKQFAGWSYSADGTVIDDQVITLTENITLYAIWEDIPTTPVVDATVSFDPNGGTGYMADVTHSINDAYPLPSCGFTAPAGKQFAGWATSADGEVISGTSMPLTGDITLYAIWEDIPTIPNNNGSGYSRKPRYDITVEDAENGKVDSSVDRSKANREVTLTVTPDDGYELDKLTVTDKNGNEIELTDNGDGTYSFKMPRSKVEVNAEFAKTADAFAEDTERALIMTIDSMIMSKDGEYFVYDVAPVIRGERTMLPIRIVAEYLGATVEWDADAQKVTITKDETVIEIFIGQPYALVNGELVQLDTSAFIENDRTYLPLRFIAENLGATVLWDGDAKTVTVIPAK